MESINITKHLTNEPIVLACSAGPDSMFLLNLLIKEKANIICAHVNHNVREESVEEEKFMRLYCEQNKIKYETITLNEKNISEANLRRKRYDFLESIIKKYNSKLLLTAHHGDDLIETILMRIVRGSNLKGYSGLLEFTKANGYKIYRPLLNVTKEEILKHNRENNIPYYIDKSNESDKYTRNRFRKQILPFLKEENKDVHKKFLKFSKEIEKTNKFVEQIVLKEYNKRINDDKLNIKNFNELESYIQEKLLEKYLTEIYKNDIDLINSKHLNLLIKLIKESGNKKIDLPKITFEKEYNMLITTKLSTPTNYNQVLENELLTPIGIIKIEDTEDTSNYTIRLNSQEIKLPLVVRNSTKEDIINIKNLNGHKKVNDVFKNEKISKEQRKIYPILVDSNNKVLWIPGLKKSKFDKTNKEIYDIIIKYQN